MIGAGLYLTVLGLLALAIGTIIGVVFVLPILTGLLPGSCGAYSSTASRASGSPFGLGP